MCKLYEELKQSYEEKNDTDLKLKIAVLSFIETVYKKDNVAVIPVISDLDKILGFLFSKWKNHNSNLEINHTVNKNVIYIVC